MDSTIEKILNYKSYSTRKKIDTLLEMDMNLYINMGADSTKTERSDTKKKSRKIYLAIKKLDKEMGSNFLKYMD